MSRSLLTIFMAVLVASSVLAGSTATPTPTPQPRAPTYDELAERVRDLEWEAGTRDLEDINRDLAARLAREDDGDEK